MMVSITLFTLGIALVPLLMLEEKEAHTLETLLVSPARDLQIVAGKALAGAIYCLSGLLVIVIAYRFLIVHWELALLAMLAGTAFVVALGLLVGIVSNNPTTIMMWATTILLILIVPTVLSGLSSFTQAPWLEALIDYWPSTATYKLLTLAMTVEIPKGMVIENAAIVISAAILLYMLTWWLVRRSDQ
jgi:ABC-type Na+ efflux pump permease subunit